MARVLLEHVWKVYPGGVVAVQDFSLEVADREFMILVGPSGCGKSTTLRMVAGLEEISRGTIRIGERTVNDVPPKDRDIAMVFQNYALYPHMTVYENMAFGLKLRGHKKDTIRRRVQDAAEILGIADLLERQPKALSGGQRQRVAVGRAIVRKPAAFLFDEPLSNLDAKLRVQMRAEISKLHNRLESTMIYVTHDQTEAMTMADRIVVMKDGLVQQVADPNTLYENPANLFVASFIGTPPMNLLSGTLVAVDGQLLFDEGNCRIPVPRDPGGALAPYVGRAVVFGIRPEHVGSMAAETQPGRPRVAARVEVIEPMGSETYLYVNTGRSALIARVDPHRKCRVGDTLQLAVQESQAHLFDPDSTRAIL
jgi:multiple sugar transport system ATP-binding protein